MHGTQNNLNYSRIETSLKNIRRTLRKEVLRECDAKLNSALLKCQVMSTEGDHLKYLAVLLGYALVINV